MDASLFEGSNTPVLPDLSNFFPIVLENSERLSEKLKTLNILPGMVTNSLQSGVDLFLSEGKTQFALIDYQIGLEDIQEFLDRYVCNLPHISTIIVDGPAKLLNQGATDCIAFEELSRERLEVALGHAGRFQKLVSLLPDPSITGEGHKEIDKLTSLISRSDFKNQLVSLSKTALEKNEELSLIVLDIDSFKGVNESKGHEFGDLILSTVAERLRQFAPTGSVLGRIGDDEFAMLLNHEGLSKISDTTIAARLSHELRQPYFIDGQTTSLSATMGIAKLDREDTPDSLLHKALSALYTAKRDKNRFMVYTKQEDAERRQQLKLAQELPDAIEKNQLRLHYQPMIRMHDSTVVGVEALVRWQHPSKGLLFPDSFIHLAEGSGSIEALTRWVLDASIRQGAEWLKSGRKLTVSVNISALILHNPIFPDIVNRLLEQFAFPAELLKLEITESAIISDVVRATDVVTRLHDLGVKVAIDDFGTGYTSLAYIRKLPVDEIKIDKSFVLNMNTVSDDAVIVRTLLELARNLDLSVVAEGVEDRETWYMLAGLGCHVAQGYYMSRPIEKETFENWLLDSPWSTSR
ncbi:putative bifunctional diguanylate cyclase/phosphodiesterase [Sneathiella glossodoripedis]|uniref:putative bifunctional diguanylate cyclase/phosphodiesterase n=1 Tax=Sneathiella glossodoripedis TaxID=418853 RepID=UPI000472BB80|nr:bifunctional diguanylate cyclase/phosphodiesterase [Sneathiella glossodoripedis]